MLGRCGATVDEQAGTVARLDRRLGDAIVGQVVVEVGDLHRPEATAATLVRSGPDPERTERVSRTGWRRRTVAARRRPMCSYAASSATRPRGVRAIIPWVMRNGSYTSSTVSGCSPTLIATVDRPTGPPVELDAQRGEDRPVDLVEAAVVDTEQCQPVAGDLGVDRTRRRGPRRSRARRRSRRLAMRGVPRDRRAISHAPSASISTSRIPAARSTIACSSLVS